MTTPASSTQRDDPATRIAMWSGPRNISTALMRSFENRPDCSVWDEPLYAHYLRETGIEHPGREEIIEVHEPDANAVIAAMIGPVPNGNRVFYQKHMAHHLLGSIERSWLVRVQHAFLVRDPKEMLLSLSKVVPNPTVEDTGLPQQLELYEELRANGAEPPVIDSRDVLENPEGMLRSLCAALDLEFLPEMLHWPEGRRDSDGVWAKHWYAAVERSTGFQTWSPRSGAWDDGLEAAHAACLGPYRTLYDHRLGAS